MHISWSDIKTRAEKFSARHAGARNERAQAQSFWNEFFDVFGIERQRVAVFESRVRQLTNKHPGFIDLFWPGLLLVEHKSAGADLATAQAQAEGYFLGLQEGEHPRYLLTCDFQNFWLRDLEERTEQRFTLAELSQRVSLFGFLLGRQSSRVGADDAVNEKAVRKLSQLHRALRRDGYTGHDLELLLVRLVFCLFADKTGIFEPKDRFLDFIERGTAADGSNLGQMLTQLFDELDTEHTLRQKSVSGWFKEFPYVNGKLFEEKLRTPSFSALMRELLLDCCRVDWSRISPAIFGSMFQHIINETTLDDAIDIRRQLGAHYTSEENIQKLIGPLFLDDLKREFEHAKSSAARLMAFQRKLRGLRFLDPACGCGNFLVITYRELRRLENEVLATARSFGARIAETFDAVAVNVDQFSGIEIEEFPAQVAQVAMWLMDHQMNVEAGHVLLSWLPRIPLRHSANIRIGNALEVDWAALCPPGALDYIIGNPPFIGKQHQTDEQKAGLQRLLEAAHLKGGGVLDYVAGWYIKATQYLVGDAAAHAEARRRAFKDAQFARATTADWLDDSGPAGAATPRNAALDIFEFTENRDRTDRARVRVAFVSTNSICQGEQVGVLWGWMLKEGMKLAFAHRTFAWNNDASGKAAVHCVIVGFGVHAAQPPRLFDYADIAGPPAEQAVKRLNPYLVDAPDVVVASRRAPLCAVPPIVFGSMPNDGGHLLLDDAERDELLAKEPAAAPWIRPFVGADEFINGISRWCLWLVDCPPQMLATLPLVKRRVAAVKTHRAGSDRDATKKLAATPQLFGEIRQPRGAYVLIPRHSSERREIIPIGYMVAGPVVGDANLCVPDATLYHFGVLTSRMHMAWVKVVCGRIKSDYRYTNQIVYNNFPWPQAPGEPNAKQVLAIESAAQQVLDARAAHGDATFGVLYDPQTMPANLTLAHRQLDTAVDAAYGFKGAKTDVRRVALLFEKYESLARGLAAESADAATP